MNRPFENTNSVSEQLRTRQLISKAVRSGASSTKPTVITVPGALPWISRPASPYRDTLTIFELGKIVV